MTRHDDLPVMITFTHGQWSLLLAAATTKRDNIHQRADRLGLGGKEASDPEIAALRRRAVELEQIRYKINGALRKARTEAAAVEEVSA